MDELREDIETRMREQQERMIDTEFREAVVDAAVAEAKIEVPGELVHAKAHEMWHQTARRLAAQGLDPARYLQMTGKTEEDLVHEAEPEAERALKRESVLAAVVEAEGIEVADEELLESLRAATRAQGARDSERKLQKALDRAKGGPRRGLREDIAMRKAVDLMVESAKAITVEQAGARQALDARRTREVRRGRHGDSGLGRPSGFASAPRIRLVFETGRQGDRDNRAR